VFSCIGDHPLAFDAAVDAAADPNYNVQYVVAVDDQSVVDVVVTAVAVADAAAYFGTTYTFADVVAVAVAGAVAVVDVVAAAAVAAVDVVAAAAVGFVAVSSFSQSLQPDYY